jgi:serine phosphatase RsbU (regulator of sigma subunit)
MYNFVICKTLQNRKNFFLKNKFMLKIKHLLLFLLLVVSYNLMGQRDTTSLLKDLNKANEKSKATIYCKLAESAMQYNVKQALIYAEKANVLANKYDIYDCKIHSLELLANLTLMNNDMKKATKFYEDELELLENHHDSLGLSLLYYNLGRLNYLQNNERKAQKYFEQSLEISRKINEIDISSKNHEILFSINYNRNNFKEALVHFKEFVKLKDSTLLQNKQKQFEVLMRNFTYVIDTAGKNLEKKEQALKMKDSAISVVSSERDTLKVVSKAQGEKIEQLNYEKAYQDELIEKQKMQRNFLILISLLGIFLFLGLFSRYQFKKKANTKLQLQNTMILQQKEEIEAQRDNLKELNNELEMQKEEIIAQRDELQEKKKIIEDKNEDITSSIRYAKRIQSAALPTNKDFEDYFKDYFILFKPRDIVSGDFYWMKKIGNRIFATVADCTGHGVPGAFVSMLGISMLNEVSSQSPDITAAHMLDRLRELMKVSLNQGNLHSESKDGMDMAFCIIDLEAKTIQFAGANNPLCLVRNGDLQVYKGTRNPVAVHVKEVPFENQEIEYQENDIIYMFSDGYPDQFGANNAGKYKISKLKTLLTEISKDKCAIQKEKLEITLNEWMLNEHQIDDITVMGIRL